MTSACCTPPRNGPLRSLYGNDVYADVHREGRRLLQSLTRNHALIDGNKRLGWLSTLVFYGLNGLELDAPDDDAYDLVIACRPEMSTSKRRPTPCGMGPTRCRALGSIPCCSPSTPPPAPASPSSTGLRAGRGDDPAPAATPRPSARLIADGSRARGAAPDGDHGRRLRHRRRARRLCPPTNSSSTRQNQRDAASTPPISRPRGRNRRVDIRGRRARDACGATTGRRGRGRAHGNVAVDGRAAGAKIKVPHKMKMAWSLATKTWRPARNQWSLAPVGGTG